MLIELSGLGGSGLLIRNIQYNTLKICNNYLLWLRLWRYGGWAETSLNQFEQKTLKTALHRNWNCLASITCTYVTKVAYERLRAHLSFLKKKFIIKKIIHLQESETDVYVDKSLKINRFICNSWPNIDTPAHNSQSQNRYTKHRYTSAKYTQYNRYTNHKYTRTQ